jgi:hypothetical protein
VLTLLDCHARFAKSTGEGSWREVDSIALADGVWFVCPKCFLANNRERPGVHGVLCWDATVPPQISPGPGRWNLRGTGLTDLTLVGGSNSIHLQGGCGWHGFIENGIFTDEQNKPL